MDLNTQPSFIPQRPVTGGAQPSRSSHSGGLFHLLGTIIFIIAFVASIGVFGYEKLLEGRIAKMQTDLEVARQELQPELIAELSRANSRFLSAEDILNKHKVVTELFKLLEAQTLPTVRFTTFLYKDDELGTSFTVKGEAKSYTTLAYQAKVLADNPYITNAQYSDFDLNKSGNVIFSLKATIDPKLVSYEDMLKRNTVLESLPVDSGPATSLNAEPAQITP